MSSLWSASYIVDIQYTSSPHFGSIHQFTGQTILVATTNAASGFCFDFLVGVQGYLASLLTAHLTHLVVTVITLCRIQMLAGRLLIEGI
jgi:hypothetical protein